MCGAVFIFLYTADLSYYPYNTAYSCPARSIRHKGNILALICIIWYNIVI